MPTYNVVWTRWQEIEAEDEEAAREIVLNNLMEAGVMEFEVESAEEVRA